MGNAHLPPNWADVLKVGVCILMLITLIGILCQSCGVSNKKGVFH